MGTTIDNEKLKIDQESLKNLETIRKWAMFIAILGFIFFGLMVIMGVIAGTFLSVFSNGNTESGFTESLILILFIVVATACFFPIFYLFRFSKHTSHAVKTLDIQRFNKAIKNLKYYFVYVGILIIIILSFYILAFIMEGTNVAFLRAME